MAQTPFIRAPGGGTLAAVRLGSQQLQVPQADVIITYNVPTEWMNATEGGASIAFNQNSDVRITGAGLLAAVRGRVSSFRLRAWTFTLDGHDFYVLRIGEDGTLVYDATTEQWVDWDGDDLPFWRAAVGMNWLGAQGLGASYGSNVVAGDDSYGQLWLLDPKRAYDESVVPDSYQQRPFERVVMGQFTHRGRDAYPCFAFFLEGDNQPDEVDFEQHVTLEISDDQGVTFWDAGTLLEQKGYVWQSLGQIERPGRLFRITDNGLFTRIDSAEMNDAE